MEVILALAVLFAIWVLVIWGSSYFNKNVVSGTTDWSQWPDFYDHSCFILDGTTFQDVDAAT